jgi:tripartite-type tricarboxylate transporter receptor subunit TctC
VASHRKQGHYEETKVKKFFPIAALACCMTGPAPVLASYPERPITIVVPYAPGGTADGLARVVAQGLEKELGASVVVESRPGASGMIGETHVARARPDGYTILYDATPLSINPAIHKTQFNVKRDFVPLSLVSVMPMVLVVSKDSRFGSVAEISATTKHARAAGKKPAQSAGKQLTFASGGIGTVQYMAGELFNQRLGLHMLHVPYKSGGPAIVAEMSGEVDMGFNNVSSILSQIQAGQLKALAVTAGKRIDQLPAVPTLQEVGLTDYEIYEWNGMLAPKKTPPEVVRILQQAIVKVMKTPEVRGKFTALGARVVASSSADFNDYLEKEMAKWNQVVKSAGLKSQ